MISNQKIELFDALYEKTLEKAYYSLKHYIGLVAPHFEFAPYHLELIEHLESFEKAETKRLIITLPPQHGKSSLGSQLFPAWYIGRHPGTDITLCSFSAELSDMHSDITKRYVGSEEHQAVFGRHSGLRVDQKGKKYWSTQNGSTFKSAGVGGMLSGFHSDIAIVDDLYKDAETANSERIIESTMNWYDNVLKARLFGDGQMLVIGTRWSERDVIGHMLSEEKHRNWTVFHYPAIRMEDGKEKALWEAKQPLEEMRTRRMENPQVFQTVYQGDPTPPSGRFFKKHWLDQAEVEKPSDEAVGLMRLYGASDYAATGESSGDYTVHIAGGLDNGGTLWILDCWRGQGESNIWVESLLDMMQEHETLNWAEEAGPIQKTINPFIALRQKERKIYNIRESFPSTQAKDVRAVTLQGLLNSGRIRFVRTAAWWPLMKAEMLTFPAGRNDDQVDTLSLLTRMIHKMQLEKRTPAPKEVIIRGIGPVETRVVEEDGGKTIYRPENADDVFKHLRKPPKRRQKKL